MSQPKISVIIPCYNGEKFIDRSIGSVYAQAYPSVQLIVVDDGSTDDSCAAIRSWEGRFADKGWELCYVYQQNRGLGGAIDTGLKYVTGEFLSLLDADDEYLPGCFAERASFMQAHPQMDVVRSNGYKVSGNDRWLFVQEEWEKQADDLFLLLLRGEANNWAGSFMMRMNALDAFYPSREIYPSRFGQNLQLLLPLCFRREVGFIDRPHMNYILQEQSLSQTNDPLKQKEHSLCNAEGYLDIRLHMLDLIVSDEAEKARYRRETMIGYHRGVMRIAAMFHDVPLMKNAYRELAQLMTPTLDDKVLLYRISSKPKWILCRLKRKLFHG